MLIELVKFILLFRAENLCLTVDYTPGLIFLLNLKLSIKNDEVNSMSKDTIINTHVCNLTDSELIERVKSLREEIFTPAKVSAIEQRKDGYCYIYSQPVDFSLKLVEFINFERKCCSGFSFALEFEPEEGPIILHIYGSGQIRELLTVMIKNSDLKDLI